MKFITTIEGHENIRVLKNSKNQKSGFSKSYDSLDEIPKPLRDTLCQAHASGLSTKHLHEIFELPLDWIETIVK